MASWDAIIIGAGIAGLSVGAVLSARGYKVRVVDPAYPYQDAASSMSAGIVVSSIHEVLAPLVKETIAVFKEYGLVLSKGALYIYPDKWCAARSRKAVEAGGFDWSTVDHDEARSLVGSSIVLGDDEVTALVEEYVVDAGSFLTRLHSKILENGGTITKSTIDNASGGIIIVAAGPWTPRIITEIRDKTIVYRCQAQALTDPLSDITIEDESLGYYLARHPGESIIGDGSNTILDNADSGFKPDVEDSYRVLELAAARLPEAAYTGFKRVWSAPCIVGLDGLPLVGHVREDIYVMTGFNGAGITLAWGAAVLLADAIEGVRRLPHEFDPTREIDEAPDRDKPREPYDLC
ncbi:MAG: FAD-binding oxidoreductase [Desulfurococcales archaeon]|nr:FAD-binding oxidoreductase [Desulfurococcales archaeon]